MAVKETSIVTLNQIQLSDLFINTSMQWENFLIQLHNYFGVLMIIIITLLFYTNGPVSWKPKAHAINKLVRVATRLLIVYPSTFFLKNHTMLTRIFFDFYSPNNSLNNIVNSQKLFCSPILIVWYCCCCFFSPNLASYLY